MSVETGLADLKMNLHRLSDGPENANLAFIGLAPRSRLYRIVWPLADQVNDGFTRCWQELTEVLVISQKLKERGP